MSTEGWLKGNKYDLETYPYGVGYDSKGEKFYWDKRLQKWYAKIHFNYKSIHLGVFDNLDDAIAARKAAEEKYFKEFNYREAT